MQAAEQSLIRRTLRRPGLQVRTYWGTKNWQDQLIRQRQHALMTRSKEDEQEAFEAAEVSKEAYYSEAWPDGTPKKFRGREAWKNFIDFDSKHVSASDELNRQRHYFFHVDLRGRLFRKELHCLESHEGQLRDARILDFFFGHMQRNTSVGQHEAAFPYVSFRAHEHYYTSCATAPVVFNDMRDGELRHLCPDGELAHSVTTLFEPASVRMTDDGKLVRRMRAACVFGVCVRTPRASLLCSSTHADRLALVCPCLRSFIRSSPRRWTRWERGRAQRLSWHSSNRQLPRRCLKRARSATVRSG